MKLTRVTTAFNRINDIQELFEGAPNYHIRVTGKPASKNQALENLSILPPGMTEQSKYCFLVTNENLTLCFVDLIRGYPSKEIAYLGLLLIPEKFQGQGFGKDSYQIIEDEILRWGEIKKIRLGVAETNDVTGYWEKMGFKKTGKISKCNEPNISCMIIEMEKVLK